MLIFVCLLDDLFSFCSVIWVKFSTWDETCCRPVGTLFLFFNKTWWGQIWFIHEILTNRGGVEAKTRNMMLLCVSVNACKKSWERRCFPIGILSCWLRTRLAFEMINYFEPTRGKGETFQPLVDRKGLLHCHLKWKFVFLPYSSSRFLFSSAEKQGINKRHNYELQIQER